MRKLKLSAVVQLSLRGWLAVQAHPSQSSLQPLLDITRTENRNSSLASNAGVLGTHQAIIFEYFDRCCSDGVDKLGATWRQKMT